MHVQRHFRQLFEGQWGQGNFACVGLDPDYSKVPPALKQKGEESPGKVILEFNKAIVKATADVASAYKPNIAFYEDHGSEGLTALYETVAYIHEVAPTVPVILDAKRGDIGNTNLGYARMAFDYLQADGITLHGYLGQEAMKPFLDRESKLCIFLCKTSNPGAGEFQDLMVPIAEDEAASLGVEGSATAPLYQHVAYQVSRSWNGNGNCALVVGAPYPEDLKKVRTIVGDIPILIPGVGKQGGSVEAAVNAGKDSRGWGMIINSSSDIIFASSGEDFAEAARAKAILLRDNIRAAF